MVRFSREGFTTADVPWGAALVWTTMFGIVSATPVIQAYIERQRTAGHAAGAGAGKGCGAGGHARLRRG